MSNSDLFQQSSGRRHKVLAILILAVCGVMFLGFAVVYWNARSSARELGADNCPEDGLVAGYLAVVLDASEAYNQIQQEAIRRDLRELLDRVPKFGRVSLFVVNDQTTERIEPVVAICSPGSDKGASWWFQNPDRLKRRWQQKFDQPLSRAIESILPVADARSSPIMEAIQNIAVKEFPRDSGAPKMIVLFSDLLQHTGSFSMYKEPDTDFVEFKDRPEFRKLSSDLSGVDIRLFYVRRDGAAHGIQGRSHVDFWDEYFKSMGGSVVEVRWIEG